MKPEEAMREKPDMNNRTVWLKIEFEQLKPDDVFKIFEETGEPVFGCYEDRVFKALDYPYVSEGVDSIKVSEIKI